MKYTWNPNDYEQHSSGFQIRNLELIPKTMKHKGKSGLEGWIRTTASLIKEETWVCNNRSPSLT